MAEETQSKTSESETMNNYQTYVLFQCIYVALGILFLTVGLVVAKWIFDIRNKVLQPPNDGTFKVPPGVSKMHITTVGGARPSIDELLRTHSRDEAHYLELKAGYDEGNLTEALIRSW